MNIILATDLISTKLKKNPPILVGQRVKLIPMEVSHIGELFEIGQSPEIWTYLPMKIEAKEDMELLVHEALTAKEQGIQFPFVIVDQQSNQLLGSTRLTEISLANKQLEIGWTWLNPKVWRTSVNTECKYLLLRFCFEELSLIRVQIKTDGRNIRSQQAIERLGATKEGILRKHRIMSDGYVRDTVMYSILNTEWPKVKDRLENFY